MEGCIMQALNKNANELIDMYLQNNNIPDWRPIGNSTDYLVSSDGQVKHICENGEERILRPWLDTSGYPSVHIHGETKRVHRLVAEAFIPNPRNLPEVHHRNENRADNRMENLMWCNRRRHMRKHNGIPIVQLSEDYKLIAVYSSAAEAEKITGISQRTIRCCCDRENHMTRCGYIWMNREDYNQFVLCHQKSNLLKITQSKEIA